MVNPYVASSGNITGSMVKGGIPVNKLLNNGVNIPTNSPTRLPSKQPAIKTGICIGRKMEPAAPSIWNNVGKVTPIAMCRAPKTVCFIIIPPKK